jgi:Rod binding domain-containing protein
VHIEPNTTMASAGSQTPQPRLVRAAHEFEAQMMKELLEPLTQSSGLGGDDSDTGAGSAGALGEYATESLAQAMSQQGGLGIATSLIQSLSHSGTSPQTSHVIGNQHEDAEIKFH